MKQEALEMQVAAMMRLCTETDERKREKIRVRTRRKLVERYRENLESKTVQVLTEVGIPRDMKGQPYMMEAVMMAAEDETVLDKMDTGLLPRLAERFRTTPEWANRCLWLVILMSCIQGDMGTLKSYFGDVLAYDTQRPLNQEYIADLAREVEERM